jgi:hypothetical protein
MMEDNLMEFDLQTSPLGFSSSLLFRQMACNNFRLSLQAMPAADASRRELPVRPFETRERWSFILLSMSK